MTKERPSAEEPQGLSCETATERTRKEVDRILSTSPLIIREFTRHLAQAPGKYIRAAALLVSAQDRQDRVPEDAVKVAAAVEILHLATLVHDDVIDNADLRRGLPTLQRKYGAKTAVICGDYLLSVAMNLAASVSRKDDWLAMKLPGYMGRLSLGELNQHINNGNYHLSVTQYLKIISGKTAALFEASFLAGAVLAGEPEEYHRKFARLGRYVGMIFQLTDDCMDFEASRQVANKPVQSDYEQDVITLPLIHAFNTVGGLRERAGESRLEREEINRVVQQAGGLAFTRALARKYHRKAALLLAGLPVSPGKRLGLEQILETSYRVF